MKNEEISDYWDAFCSEIFDQNRFSIKLGLDQIKTALALEGNPQTSAKAIVVGGTNGKGETAATLSKILTAHQLKVGLFTSPHLIEYRERFRVDGLPATRSDILRIGRTLLDRYRADRDDIDSTQQNFPPLTFFELTTLLAAIYFKEKQVDVVIWEVGLGGRLDATNAIEPDLTIITNIGIDHQAYLGDDIFLIAEEKSGLIRKDAPTIIAPQEFLELIPFFKSKAPHAIFIEDHNFEEGSTNRKRNQKTALKAAEVFLARQDINITFNPKLAKEVLPTVTWWGRSQFLTHDNITFFVDGAHNAQGAQSVSRRIEEWPVDAFFISAMRDKDLSEIFGWLSNYDVPIFFVRLKTERAASCHDLQKTLPNITSLEEISVDQVLPCAKNLNCQRACVFGSLFLVGALLQNLGYCAEDFAI